MLLRGVRNHEGSLDTLAHLFFISILVIGNTEHLYSYLKSIYEYYLDLNLVTEIGNWVSSHG